MTIEKDMQRLFWRFGNGNFTPNDNDIKALKGVAEFINLIQKETLRKQQLFAKFYVRTFADLLSRRGNLAMAQKEVDQICIVPLSEYVHDFYFRLNVLKFKMSCEEKGIPFVSEAYETKEDIDLVSEFIKNDKDFVKHALGYWPKEKVEKSLTNQMIEVIALTKELD